eukprot:293891-Chlamydomonas_euryale.AAC.1
MFQANVAGPSQPPLPAVQLLQAKASPTTPPCGSVVAGKEKPNHPSLRFSRCRQRQAQPPLPAVQSLQAKGSPTTPPCGSVAAGKGKLNHPSLRFSRCRQMEAQPPLPAVQLLQAKASLTTPPCGSVAAGKGKQQARGGSLGRWCCHEAHILPRARRTRAVACGGCMCRVYTG